jgi:hypothetical protein
MLLSSVLNPVILQTLIPTDYFALLRNRLTFDELRVHSTQASLLTEMEAEPESDRASRKIIFEI